MRLSALLRYVALAGDSIYVLWVLYDGVAGRYSDITSEQAIGLIGLLLLLGFNIVLLLKRQK